MDNKLIKELMNISLDQLEATIGSDKFKDNFNPKDYEVDFAEDIELKTSTIKKLIINAVACGLSTGLKFNTKFKEKNQEPPVQ